MDDGMRGSGDRSPQCGTVSTFLSPAPKELVTSVDKDSLNETCQTLQKDIYIDKYFVGNINLTALDLGSWLFDWHRVRAGSASFRQNAASCRLPPPAESLLCCGTGTGTGISIFWLDPESQFTRNQR